MLRIIRWCTTILCMCPTFPAIAAISDVVSHTADPVSRVETQLLKAQKDQIFSLVVGELLSKQKVLGRVTGEGSGSNENKRDRHNNNGGVREDSGVKMWTIDGKGWTEIGDDIDKDGSENGGGSSDSNSKNSGDEGRGGINSTSGTVSWGGRDGRGENGNNGTDGGGERGITRRGDSIDSSGDSGGGEGKGKSDAPIDGKHSAEGIDHVDEMNDDGPETVDDDSNSGDGGEGNKEGDGYSVIKRYKHGSRVDDREDVKENGGERFTRNEESGSEGETVARGGENSTVGSNASHESGNVGNSRFSQLLNDTSEGHIGGNGESGDKEKRSDNDYDGKDRGNSKSREGNGRGECGDVLGESKKLANSDGDHENRHLDVELISGKGEESGDSNTGDVGIGGREIKHRSKDSKGGEEDEERAQFRNGNEERRTDRNDDSDVREFSMQHWGSILVAVPVVISIAVIIAFFVYRKSCKRRKMLAAGRQRTLHVEVCFSSEGPVSENDRYVNTSKLQWPSSPPSPPTSTTSPTSLPRSTVVTPTLHSVD